MVSGSMPMPWSVTLKQSHRGGGAPCEAVHGGGGARGREADYFSGRA